MRPDANRVVRPSPDPTVTASGFEIISVPVPPSHAVSSASPIVNVSVAPNPSTRSTAARAAARSAAKMSASDRCAASTSAYSSPGIHTIVPPWAAGAATTYALKAPSSSSQASSSTGDGASSATYPGSVGPSDGSTAATPRTSRAVS